MSINIQNFSVKIKFKVTIIKMDINVELDTGRPEKANSTKDPAKKEEKKNLKKKHTLANQLWVPLPDRTAEFFSMLPFYETPVHCPVTECDERMPSTLLTAHFLQLHSNCGLKFKEAIAGKKTEFDFNITTLKCKDNLCIGVVAYSGDPKEPSNFRFNKVPVEYSRYVVHLPVFLMASRTKKLCFTEDSLPEVIKCDPSTITTQKNYVFWLATLYTENCGRCFLSVSDKDKTMQRVVVVSMRSLLWTQAVNEVVKENSSFLLMRDEEMSTFTDKGRHRIVVEVTVNNKKKSR